MFTSKSSCGQSGLIFSLLGPLMHSEQGGGGGGLVCESPALCLSDFPNCELQEAEDGVFVPDIPTRGTQRG